VAKSPTPRDLVFIVRRPLFFSEIEFCDQELRTGSLASKVHHQAVDHSERHLHRVSFQMDSVPAISSRFGNSRAVLEALIDLPVRRAHAVKPHQPIPQDD
jgi:hypothetical protein